jgi:predicted ATPase
LFVQFIVPPLALPSAESDFSAAELNRYAAIELFVARAKAIKSSFVLRDETAATVAEICRKLDGLPLAIELAAARVRLLSVTAILGRLENRLQLLTSRTCDLPSRQQTMRDAIAWSYDLLDEKTFAASFAADRKLSAPEAVSLALDK